ncbi:MAG TPA: glutathione S-transferase family protein [Parvibaculum sp.]
MGMKLYNSQLSPFSARVRIAAYAKNLDIEIISAFLDPAALAELEKINPMRMVPTLVSDGLVLPESEVICEYFEDLGLTPSLRPADAEGRARMRLLSRIGDLYIMDPMTRLAGQISPKGRDQALVERELAELASGMSWLNFYLDGSAFAVGGRLSLADCTLAPILFFYAQIGPMFGYADVFKDTPSVSSYYKAMKNDPNIARVLGEMEVALRKVFGG